MAGFERYEVSEFGQVRSLVNPRKPRILKPVVRKGYHRVYLRAGNSTTTFLVHRLVALVYLGECPEGLEVCHNDGDSANNSVSNLRYDTSANNKLDSVRHGTHRNVRKTACPKGHSYIKVDSEGRRRCGECK